MYKIEQLLLSFSKQRYYELLELEKLDQLDKETKDDLRFYNGIACAQINWEMKDRYFSVLDDYCMGKLNESELGWKLKKISKSAWKLQEIIRQHSFIISPHLKCLKLNEILLVI